MRIISQKTRKDGRVMFTLVLTSGTVLRLIADGADAESLKRKAASDAAFEKTEAAKLP